jgi:hypothetical protein
MTYYHLSTSAGGIQVRALVFSVVRYAGRTYTERDIITQLEHDPEKWVPVFGKDHAPTKQ